MAIRVRPRAEILPFLWQFPPLDPRLLVSEKRDLDFGAKSIAGIDTKVTGGSHMMGLTGFKKTARVEFVAISFLGRQGHLTLRNGEASLRLKLDEGRYSKT